VFCFPLQNNSRGRLTCLRKLFFSCEPRLFNAFHSVFIATHEMKASRDLPSKLTSKVGLASKSQSSRSLNAVATDLIIFSILLYTNIHSIRSKNYIYIRYLTQTNLNLLTDFISLLNTEIDFTFLLEAKGDVLLFCGKNKLTCSATSLFIVIGAIRSILIAVRSTRRLFSLICAFNNLLRGFFFQTTVPLSFFLFGAFPLWHSVSENGWPYRLLSSSMWIDKLNNISMSIGMNDYLQFKADLIELYEHNYWKKSSARIAASKEPCW